MRKIVIPCAAQQSSLEPASCEASLRGRIKKLDALLTRDLKHEWLRNQVPAQAGTQAVSFKRVQLREHGMDPSLHLGSAELE